MAIELKEEKQINWKLWLSLLIIVALAAVAGYVLFGQVSFQEETALLIPKSQTTELSRVKFQPDLDNLIKELPPQGKFKLYIGRPAVGQLGRENPFIKF